MSDNCSSKYNNLDKWKSICEVTLSNYSNMKKRLSQRETISNFILVYYSLFLIICTLTGKYFPSILNSELSEYFSIILSVVLLVYSLINSNARYSERIRNIEDSMNALKTIKRSLNGDNLKEQIEKYNTIVDTTEMRQDVDFFNTVKSLCKRNHIVWYARIYNIKVNEEDRESITIKGYLSEINRLYEQTRLIFVNICDLILTIIPVGVFIICIIIP